MRLRTLFRLFLLLAAVAPITTAKASRTRERKETVFNEL